MNPIDTATTLAAHPWVTRATVCADGALVLPSAEGIDTLRAHGRQTLLDGWRAWLSQRGAPAPVAWRLCDDWAHTAPEVLLRQALPTAAIIDDQRNGDDGAHELALRLPLDLACFADHFPTLPVLPGVLQLQWALAFGAERFGTPRACRRMDMLKFHHLLRPGDRPLLRLRHDAMARRLHFAYQLGGAEASSGRFAWEGVAP